MSQKKTAMWLNCKSLFRFRQLWIQRLEQESRGCLVKDLATMTVDYWLDWTILHTYERDRGWISTWSGLNHFREPIRRHPLLPEHHAVLALTSTTTNSGPGMGLTSPSPSRAYVVCMHDSGEEICCNGTCQSTGQISTVAIDPDGVSFPVRLPELGMNGDLFHGHSPWIKTCNGLWFTIDSSHSASSVSLNIQFRFEAQLQSSPVLLNDFGQCLIPNEAAPAVSPISLPLPFLHPNDIRGRDDQEQQLLCIDLKRHVYAIITQKTGVTLIHVDEKTNSARRIVSIRPPETLTARRHIGTGLILSHRSQRERVSLFFCAASPDSKWPTTVAGYENDGRDCWDIDLDVSDYLPDRSSRKNSYKNEGIRTIVSKRRWHYRLREARTAPIGWVWRGDDRDDRWIWVIGGVHNGHAVQSAERLHLQWDTKRLTWVPSPHSWESIPSIRHGRAGWVAM